MNNYGLPPRGGKSELRPLVQWDIEEYESVLTNLDSAMREGNREAVAVLVAELNRLSERLQHKQGLSEYLEKGTYNSKVRERLRKDYISQYVLLRGGAGPFITDPGAYPTKTSKDEEEEAEGLHVPCVGTYIVGGWLPCRTLAPISFPALESNRHRTLYAAHLLCAVAVVLSMVACLGAFAKEGTLSYLSWVKVTSDKGVGIAGVKWVCWDLPDPDGDGTHWECQTWYDFDCSKGVTDTDACEACKHKSTHIAMSVFLGVFAYISYLHTTDRRLRGNDSNFLKFKACFAAFVGGTNSFLAAAGYWSTCVLSVQSDPTISASPGPGLICLTLAILLKIFMGGVHLGIPVQKNLLQDKASVDDSVRTIPMYNSDQQLAPPKNEQTGFLSSLRCC